VKFKGLNDKNNYLSSEEDYSILRRLLLKNENTSVELYTKFIYRNFLKKFNRFFTQREQTKLIYIKGKSIYEIYETKTLDEIFKENKEA